MKNTQKSFRILSLLLVLLIFFSCDQSEDESGDQTKIENTLKSVSLFQDSLGIDPSKLFTDFERVNVAIDSIGYPDAGYKIWEVVSDDSLSFRFMVEGFWPDQKTYEIIHNHELYKKATIENENSSWISLKSTWYYRFNRVR